jgi:hypothetical protein
MMKIVASDSGKESAVFVTVGCAGLPYRFQRSDS